MALNAQFAEMAVMGPERAAKAIDHSIRNDWKSIHEPKSQPAEEPRKKPEDDPVGWAEFLKGENMPFKQFKYSPQFLRDKFNKQRKSEG